MLVTISGVAWRITTSDSTVCLGIEHGPDFEHCGRQQCMRNSGMSHGLLYPEFQHRSPPPSYQASMQEYRLRYLILKERERGSMKHSLCILWFPSASNWSINNILLFSIPIDCSC